MVIHNKGAIIVFPCGDQNLFAPAVKNAWMPFFAGKNAGRFND